MTWPVLNIIKLRALVRKSHAPGFDGSQVSKGGGAKAGPLAELFFRHLRLSTYLAVTLVTYFFFWPIDRAAHWEFGWVCEVL